MKKIRHRLMQYVHDQDHSIDLIIVMVILLLPLYSVRITLFGIPLGLLEILTVSALIISFLRGIIQFSEIKRQVPLVIGSLLMCLGVFIATIFGDHFHEGFGVLKSWFIVPILFALVVWMRGMKDDGVLKVYLGAYFVSTVIVSVVALVYFISGEMTYDGRLRGSYVSPNYLALYIAPALLFLFYYKSMPPKWRFILMTGVGVIALTLYLTNSFSAWIAVLASIVIMVILLRPKRRLYILGIVIMSLTLLVVQYHGQKMDDLRNMPERSSLASRIMIWESAVMIGQDHSIFGITPNTFQEHYLIYQKYFPPYLEWAVPQPHNLYLAFWLESGLIGLTGFLTVLWWFYRQMYPFIRKNASAAFLVASMTSIVLYGFMDTPYWKNDLAFVFWLLIGVGASLISHLQQVHPHRSQVDTIDHRSD